MSIFSLICKLIFVNYRANEEIDKLRISSKGELAKLEASLKESRYQNNWFGTDSRTKGILLFPCGLNYISITANLKLVVLKTLYANRSYAAFDSFSDERSCRIDGNL